MTLPHGLVRIVLTEQLYRAVLRADPNDADALNLLGVLEYQRGQSLAALEDLWLSHNKLCGPSREAYEGLKKC